MRGRSEEEDVDNGRQRRHRCDRDNGDNLHRLAKGSGAAGGPMGVNRDISSDR